MDVVNDPMTDGTVLRERQYAGPGNLAARQALWTYRTGPELPADRIDALGLAGGETVLDVGCGNGRYLAELLRRGHSGRLLGLDLSAGMARAAAAASGASVAVADAAHLPVATGAVDVALAMHMLYHVPDLPAAIAEGRRVVRPGGVLLASTNGDRHIAEVVSIMDEAVRAVTGRPRAERPFSFTLETGGALLARSFDHVTAHERVEVVRAPGPEPVIAYLTSFGPEHVGVSAGAQWEAFLDTATRLVRARAGGRGEVPVTSHTGHFVCR